MFLTCKILKTKFHSNKEALKIDAFFSLFDADLLMIWMNNFRHGFRFCSASCPVLHIVLITSRGECIRNWSDCFEKVSFLYAGSFTVLVIATVFLVCQMNADFLSILNFQQYFLGLDLGILVNTVLHYFIIIILCFNFLLNFILITLLFGFYFT